MKLKAAINSLCIIGLALVLAACKSTGGVSSTDPDANLDPAAAADAKVVPMVKGLPPDPGPAAIPRIGIGDLLQVSVFMADELSIKQRVTNTGDIFMPLVGAIQVNGLTQEEAQKLITAKLAKDHLQNPVVNVFVEESATQNVTVAGEVAQPGVYPIKGQMTLLQALAQARGVKGTAEDEIVIFRSLNQDKITAYVIDVEQIQEGEIGNPVLIGGDTVHVARSGTTVFFDKVLGFVQFSAIPLGG